MKYLIYYLIYSLIVLLGLIFDQIIKIHRSDKTNTTIYDLLDKPSGCFVGLLLFTSVLVWVYCLVVLKCILYLVRLRPIPCSRCGIKMKRLNKRRKQAYLSKVELLENSLRSIYHDVWFCDKCNTSEKYSYINRRSSVSKCSSCSARTFVVESRIVLQEPTETREGKKLAKCVCKNCGYRENVEYATNTTSSWSSHSSGSD